MRWRRGPSFVVELDKGENLKARREIAPQTFCLLAKVRLPDDPQWPTVCLIAAMSLPRNITQHGASTLLNGADYNSMTERQPKGGY